MQTCLNKTVRLSSSGHLQPLTALLQRKAASREIDGEGQSDSKKISNLSIIHGSISYYHFDLLLMH